MEVGRMIEPYYQADRVTLYLGDCIEVMRELPEASVDAIVTDPPYGLEFMGKDWDSFAPDRKNASVWNGRRESNAGWEDHAAGRAGRGGGGPQYASKQRPAKRCQKCGRRSFSGTPCVCPDPDWVLEYQQAAPSAMLAFQAWCEVWAREAYRVLKPGGHIVAFGGTRTHHRLVCGIEDAGFEIRDELDWLYGAGFPKSLDVSKAIDRHNGDARERDVLGGKQTFSNLAYDGGLGSGIVQRASAASAASAAWEGWGTALKPAHEPICLARKPLVGTVAQNVLAHGTGAINVDGCRIGEEAITTYRPTANGDAKVFGKFNGGESSTHAGRWPPNVILDEEAAALLDATVGESKSPPIGSMGGGSASHSVFGEYAGVRHENGYGDRGGPSRFFEVAQWTTDDVSDAEWSSRLQSEPDDSALSDARTVPESAPSLHGQESIADYESSTQRQSRALSADHQGGTGTIPITPSYCGSCGSALPATAEPTNSANVARVAAASGPASVTRFQYTSKASRSEREAGLDDLPPALRTDGRDPGGAGGNNPRLRVSERRNDHPTVKPVAVMRWLVRLITPPGGVVLDPFLGSGTTGMAALDEGMRFIGIDMTERYVEIARYRVTHRHVIDHEVRLASEAIPQGRLL